MAVAEDNELKKSQTRANPEAKAKEKSKYIITK